MPALKTTTSAAVYQLKVTLKGVRPPIWRRLQVRGNVSLHNLHRLIQEAMGWMDGHLHQFRVGRITYGEPSPEWSFPVRSERKAALSEVLPAQGARLDYDYDFGDDWQHSVVVERILSPEPRVTYPRCLAGKGACPPEDCGGRYGYERLIAIMKDPSLEEHVEMKAWLGRDLDPKAFDLAEVNRALSRLR